jgi:hypothetical protein
MAMGKKRMPAKKMMRGGMTAAAGNKKKPVKMRGGGMAKPIKMRGGGMTKKSKK